MMNDLLKLANVKRLTFSSKPENMTITLSWLERPIKDLEMARVKFDQDFSVMFSLKEKFNTHFGLLVSEWVYSLHFKTKLKPEHVIKIAEQYNFEVYNDPSSR